MSGGSFNYVYQKLVDLADGFKNIAKAVTTIRNLMQDVEWVESYDSSWDTEMAGDWYKQVYNLCGEFDEGQKLDKPRPPQAPTHYPEGKAHCQYCGAEEKNWNEDLKLKKRTSRED